MSGAQSPNGAASMPTVRALLEASLPAPPAEPRSSPPRPWSGDNPHRQLLRVRHLQLHVAEQNWPVVLESIRGGTAQYIDNTDQIIIFQMAMQNNQPLYRSLHLFRHLLKYDFPMENVDVALEVVLKNHDLDTLHEICNFFVWRYTKPIYPHSLSYRAKIRMILLLQRWPAGEFYLQEATRSLYWYSYDTEIFSLDAAKECLIFILLYVNDSQERGAMLWEMFLTHDVFEDAASHLKQLPFPRAVVTVRAVMRQVEVSPWCWDTERENFERLCAMLLDSGLLTAPHIELIHFKLERARLRAWAERQRQLM